MFYIGKSKDDRCLHHLFEDDDHPKVQRIRDIFAAGLEPRIEVLAHGMATSDEAYLVEAAAIDLIGLKELTNKVMGHNSLLYGRKTLKDLAIHYAPVTADISEPVVLIRINELYRNGMSARELYEVTRGVWILGLDRARGAKYVFAIFEGIVKEVYEPEFWQDAQVAGYETLKDLTPEDGKGRIEFVGKVAPEAIRSQYIDKSVASSFAFGSQNPCKYINC